MSSSDSLKQKKIDNLMKAYDFFKKAEAAGTLKKVSLTQEQRSGLRPSHA